MSDDTPTGPRRVLAGVRLPGGELRAFTGAGSVPLRSAAPADPTHNRTTGSNTMSRNDTTAVQAPINPATTPLIRFEAWDVNENHLVSVRGPISVAAAAARNWADVVDPYDMPDMTQTMRAIPWKLWLSKLLPFLARR